MSSLYERVLGPSYNELAHVLHQFHAVGSHGQAHGKLAIEHGTGKAARMVARLLGMPDESPHTEVTLHITADDQCETWDRTFGEKKLRTRAWSRDGLLIEAMGPSTLGFRLLVENGGLRFVHERTWVFGIPLPKWIAPRAEVHVKPAGERWKLDMRLSQPQLGLIVRYHGTMAPVASELKAAARA